MKNNNLMICECSSTQHQISYNKIDGDEFIYCHIHLNNYNFFKRILIGIKYIFGYKSIYGNYEEFILSKKHIDDLNEIIKYLKEN